MVRALLGVVAVSILGASSQAQAQGELQRRTISVSATAETRAAPNLAIVSFAVVTEAKKATDASAENAKRSTALFEALKQTVGSAGKVTTSGYSVQPKYIFDTQDGGRAPRLDGYTVTNQISAETSDIKAVGALIDRALAAGANQVGNVTFTLSEQSAALNEALAKAGAAARTQAESVAMALGVQIKGVVSASTQGSARPQPRIMSFAREAFAEAKATTPIESGDVTVSAELSVTYEIE